MERLIFLDIDGVLNTRRSMQQMRGPNSLMRGYTGLSFDLEAMQWLNYIVDNSQADIVITSSWKYKGLEAMRNMWTEYAMHGYVKDITPSIQIRRDLFCMRGMEILKWLSENYPEGMEQLRYVIIDDGDDFLPEQAEMLVRTNAEVGITREDAAKAINILTK